DQRMQHDVGVGMTGDAVVVSDAHATEPDMIAFDELMHIEAEAGANVRKRRDLGRLRAREILWRRKLHVADLAFKSCHAMSRPFRERGITGKVVAPSRCCAPMRREQKIKSEGLRRLHHPER